MELGALLLLLAVILLVGIFISRPFFQKAAPLSPEPPGSGQQLSSLMAERDRVINTLQELDFDFKLGKIPGDEYPTIRADLLKKGSDILRQIDLLRGKGQAVSVPAEALEDTLPASAEEDAIEKLIAERRGAHLEKANGFCPQCGKPVLKSDRFCPKCGTALRS